MHAEPDSRHIVALGGGGYAHAPYHPALDDFILSLARENPPRVCLLATARGDRPEAIVPFYRTFAPPRARPAHLDLFERSAVDLRAFLLAQDVIFVGGGNTANMLAVWRVHGVDRLLREAWEQGIVLAGVSAGMLCWFEGGVTDSFGPLAALRDGLGILAGSACPHYDGEADRRPTYLSLVASGRLPPGVAADDGVGLHFQGTRLAEAVSARPLGRAFHVLKTAAGAEESPLAVRCLDS